MSHPDPTGRPRWTPLALVYLALAVIGLVATWTFNILAIRAGTDFFGEWGTNGFATQSLQVDSASSWSSRAVASACVTPGSSCRSPR
jgi:hypothetical protein